MNQGDQRTPGAAANRRLKWFYLIGGVLLLWALVIALMVGAFRGTGTAVEVTNILLSSVNVGLILFSLVIAGAAMFGWQSVKTEIDEAVERRFGRGSALAMQEIRGRIYSATGTMQGDLSADPTWKQLEPLNPERAALAAELCRQGYLALKDLGEGPELMALNNKIFYGTLSDAVMDGAVLLEEAERLRLKGAELNLPHLRLTYCRAVLVYSGDLEQVRMANDLVERLLRSRRLSPLELKEAELYSAKFAKRIAELSG